MTYLLFSGPGYDHGRGFEDFQGAFPDEENAIAYFKASQDAWGQIVLALADEYTIITNMARFGRHDIIITEVNRSSYI